MVTRLSELDQMKRDLLSNVSHELKGPLASMQETTGLLLEEIPGPLSDSQRRLLELTRKSAARLSGMISKLLDMARIDAGVLEYDLKAQPVEPVIQTALAELHVRAGERGVRLVFQPGQGPYVARLDADRFAQVAGNLIENAIKFSPPGGLVEAVLEPAGPGLAHPASGRGGSPGGRRILITIADRGPGVPEGQREKIFERFHQVPRTARRGEGGVGLGLAICREIVTAHGGDLWVEERPGGGSLFRILLPLAPAPPSGEGTE
jgi:two-component system sensor histidine kinase GlrK